MFANLGKSLKGLIMEDETPPQTQTATAGAIVSVPNLRVVAPDNQFVDALREAIKGRSTALTALTTAAEKLITVIPDPDMRLKAAFQMIKGDGRGVKELLDAITVHIADLESQKLQFTRAMDAESQTTIGQLQTELSANASNAESAQAQIKSMQAQIDQLRQELMNNSNRKIELDQKIQAETARLSQNSQLFELALITVKNELENQRKVIQTSLS